MKKLHRIHYFGFPDRCDVAGNCLRFRSRQSHRLRNLCGCLSRRFRVSQCFLLCGFGLQPERVGFIRRGEAGASPDSLIGKAGLLEVKTKLPWLHLEALLAGVLPPEHKPQVQGQLWIAEREWCDFVSYWPKLPLFCVRVYRDEPYIALLAEAVGVFNSELDALTERVRQAA